MDVRLISKNEQVIITQCTFISSGVTWYLATLYASNRESERRMLRKSLANCVETNQGAWIISGDFNCVRFQDEKIGGNPVPACKLIPFNNFIEGSGLSDLKILGASWTWTNRQQMNAIACKLDRVLVNGQWFELFLNSYAST